MKLKEKIDGLLFLDSRPIYFNPIYIPRRKKLKGWQKEMKRNNPARFFKGRKK